MLSRISRSFAKPFKSVQTFNSSRFAFSAIRYNFTSTSDPTQVALLEETEAKVFQVLKSATKCNQAKLTKSATFEELGFDSLDSVELVVAME